MLDRLVKRAVLFILLSVIAVTLLLTFNRKTKTSSERSAAAGTNEVTKAEPATPPLHAYHKEPPTGALPETLDPSRFKDNHPAFVAYSIAAKIRKLLYQEPCYCGCDAAQGHQSLLDCFTTRHGVLCHACQSEVLFCLERKNKGSSAAEIREAMDKREFLQVDFAKYVTTNYAKYQQERRRASLSRRGPED
jgi:hypothetical protein